jgi:hypothetical protein
MSFEDTDACLLSLALWLYLLDVGMIVYLELEAIILAVVHLQNRVLESIPATLLQNRVIL